MPASDVARAFGLGTPAREMSRVARGAMGEVFRLDTERGTFAAKRLLWGAQGDEEANVAFQFAAADAGVPLPRPLLTTNGDVLKRLDDGWWRAFEWVDGAHIAGNGPTLIDVAVGVARSVGSLHALCFDAGSVVEPWFLGTEYDDDEIGAALDVAERHGVAVDSARRALPALAAVSHLPSAGDPIGCHNDVQRTNVMVAAGRPVLIDWDNAGANYAAGEFANALYGFGYDGDDDHKAATIAGMTRAYREAGGSFKPGGLEVFATVCSPLVNYAVNCCRHLDDETASPEDLAFERPIIEGLADYPVTVAKLEHLLEAVPDE